MRADPTFAELYSDPKAKLADADELLRSMDGAGIDVSVVLGFAWADEATCRQHNQYLIEAAAASQGRIVAFPNLPLGAGWAAVEAEAQRCAAAGVRGFGELRPDNLGFDLEADNGECLAKLALELNVGLLFHVSEPVGHVYPGKQGLSLSAFESFVGRFPDVKVVGAHWGGGLPFYAHMPEVARAFTGQLRVDTAASRLLYGASVYKAASDLCGADRILFGSDFPLLSQERSRRRIEQAGLDARTRELILGGNAASLLDLS